MVIADVFAKIFRPKVYRPIASGKPAAHRARRAECSSFPSRPVSSRSIKQMQAGEGATALTKKASAPIPWLIRFRMQLFAIRQAWAWKDSAALTKLVAEIQTFRESLTDCQYAAGKFESMETKIRERVVVLTYRETIPVPEGPVYGGW